jgi:hypothetical protein
MKYAALLLLPLLFACNERYRYPCQDPENWEEKQCQKPYCTANGTCPEDLKHYVKDSSGKPIIPQQEQQITKVPNKGDCK